MRERTNTTRSITRRSALTLLGASGGLVLGATAGAARTDPKPEPHAYHAGDGISVGDGGVYVSIDGFESFPAE